MLDAFVKDVRFAIRQLRQRPGFTSVAVLVLALGLGANASIFSLVNAVLLKPLPFPDPDRLIALFEKDVIPNGTYNAVAPGNFLDWQRGSKNFEQIAATRNHSFNLASSSRSFTPVRVSGALASANLFQTLGVAPILGRTFREEEDRHGAPYVAIISYSLWKQRFAGSPSVLHRHIRLDENNYDIIGVMPEGFTFPRRNVQVWVTLQTQLSPYELASHSDHSFMVVGRLRPGVSFSQGLQEIDAITKRFKKDHPVEIMGRGASAMTLNDLLVIKVRSVLLILLASVGCLLLIACVNIANLLLTRAVGRQRELAIRAAVGATRAQIIRQLLIESITISLLGAVAGLLVASWASNLLSAHAPNVASLAQVHSTGIDHSVFLFTMGLSLLTGIFAGIFPALSASRTDLVNSLKDGNRSATPGRSQGKLRDVLVAFEVALSLVLLIAAGLLVRSFTQILNVRPGLRTENIVTLSVSLPDAAYQDRSAKAAFVRNAIVRLNSLPGVQSAGAVDCAPLDGSCGDDAYRIVGHPLPPGQMMDLPERQVDSNYFKTAAIPLLRGRLFTPEDNQGYDDLHPRLDPVIISESTVEQYFGGRDPIGQRLLLGTDAGTLPEDPKHPNPEYQVIGVVGDVLQDLEQPVQGILYLPILDGNTGDFYFIVHAANDPKSVIGAIRAEIHKLDPNLPIHDVRTIDQITAESLAGRQYTLVLLTLFAGLALLLASIGLYGVVSYAVSQRTSEIGIRIALGAARQDVSRMVLIQGMKPAVAGIALGLIGAFIASGALKSLLFGVGAADPITFFAVPILLLLVVAAACMLPALRATRIDPTVALRAE